MRGMFSLKEPKLWNQQMIFFGSISLNLSFSWSISLFSWYKNDFHTKFPLKNWISKSCSQSFYESVNYLMVTLCHAEWFPACFLLVDMGKHYIHSVNNILLYNDGVNAYKYFRVGTGKLFSYASYRHWKIVFQRFSEVDFQGLGKENWVWADISNKIDGLSWWNGINNLNPLA